MKKRVPMPIKLIDGKKFRLHCTRVTAAPLAEYGKLVHKGFIAVMEEDHGVYKLWKEVKRE